ncbi:HAD-IB family hydrolase [Vagococcus sp. WN89Y]|uniref:HAD-IB family hydrolase n=1 Tax=Vagococcus sp. WN89Y TaxID=3457258 RepID=UPI003FCE0499
MIPLSETKNNVLSVFDFDGTLTRHDSFIPFLRFAFGYRIFARKMTKLVMPTIKCMRRKLTRDELKEVLITTFLAGVEEQWVREKAEAYCKKYWDRLMRPSGLLAVAAEVSSGAEVTLCSASPAIVLQPFADKLGIKLIGTHLESKEGVLSGRIDGHNCRCIQKIHRLEAVYGPLSQFHLRVWGDTRGDAEMLAAAKDAHWRHFHPAWVRKKPPLERFRAAALKEIK